jgi:hypothetical protein
MKSVFSVAAALAVCAGVAHAQTVEFRIIERKGRTVVTGAADAQLDLAVQARVVGAAPDVAVSGWGFNVHIVGELEANGVLERGFISNPDHTLSSAIGVSSVVGQSGVAAQYSYLAGLNASFNGLINVSSSTFTNGPDQEIGIVAGSMTSTAFLATPGIDLNADGNPDTWGDGTGATPDGFTYAPIPSTILQEYLGANGNWVDVYRFRYTVTNFSARTLDIRVDHQAGSACTFLIFNNSLWGPSEQTSTTATNNLLIGVGTPVAGACCTGTACTVALPAACAGTFLGLSACAANACAYAAPSGSACCVGLGCSVIPTSAPCPGFRPSGQATCLPTICALTLYTRPCCNASGQCAMATSCATPYYGASTCTPNPCPAPLSTGACCRANTNQCVATLAGECVGAYHGGGACFPSPCTATPGTCCSLTTGSCAFVTHDLCTGQNYWLAVGVCTPNPCPPPSGAGACCLAGTCYLTIPSACPGSFSGGATCGISTCQTTAACCDWATGNCAVILSTACIGPLPSRTTCVPTPCPTPPIVVQARFVERHNRSLVTGPADAQLELAVQARIVSAGPSVALAGLAFDVHIAGESESSGTLARAQTSNTDHTYSTAFALSDAVGIGGLASQFTYAAAGNPSYNGLINVSGGTFSNGPDQEIGLINASTAGPAFLTTPGIDNDMDANPDSWPGSGSGQTPPNNARAVLSPAASPVYFGAAAHWVDVYRFRYTVTSFTSRSLVFHVESPQAQVFSQVQFAAISGLWSPLATTEGVDASDLIIGVVDAVPGACCAANGNCALFTRTDCVGQFLGSTSCFPYPCSAPVATGACCAVGSICTLVPADMCEGTFIGAAVCDPSPCPPPGLAVVCCVGACCQNRACSISTESGCPSASGYSFKGPGTTCSSDPDPSPCCPANFNGYGGVNVQDLYDFLTAWFIQDPTADFDGSGVVTTIDVLEFLRVWIGGC